ncbi:GTPase [Aquisphaera insulae]|uniref:GTPase n=1 Tax=Aquisphaera insulae TaxID=2712864 RepID=UPI0013ED81F3|nr:GTPase [Aquisphaera insulae]
MEGLSPLMAVLTPPGRGAIAVIQVWGEGATQAVDACFRPARGPGLSEGAPGQLRLGRIGRGAGDEVVAVRLDGPRSAIELQCHGGPAAVGLVMEALGSAGVVATGTDAWAAWQGDSRIQAEALEDLPLAPTVRTAEILLEQAQGALDRELVAVEEELQAGRIDAAGHRIDLLLERARIGLRLLSGWSVVLAGAPNVGKSRLLNALAGYRRAIVDSTPGTTRDVVTVPMAFDGWPIQLSDTAGRRHSDDPIERSGLDRARLAVRSADLVLVVLDRSGPLAIGEEDEIVTVEPDRSVLVANKSDRPAAWHPETVIPADRRVVVVSAATGEGLDGLSAAIVAAILPDLPPPGAAIPFRVRHRTSLETARRSLAAGDRQDAIREIRSLRRDRVGAGPSGGTG